MAALVSIADQRASNAAVVDGRRGAGTVWALDCASNLRNCAASYVYMCYVYMCIHVYTCVYMCIHVYTCVYMCIHVYTCVYMCIHVYTCVYMCVYVRMCVCV